MIRILKHLRWHHYIMIIISVIFVYLQVRADLEIPSRLAEILSHSLNPGDNADNYIFQIGLTMLGFVVLSIIATIIVALLASIIAAQLSNDIRKAMYKKVQNFSFEEMDKFSTASLITRTTNDVNQVQMVVIMILRMAISAPFMAFNSISRMQQGSGELSWVLVGSVSAVILLMVTIVILVVPKFGKIQKLTDNLNLVTRENLTGIRVIRAHGAEKLEEEKFAKTNEEFRKLNTFANRAVSFVMPGLVFIMNMTSLPIIWLGIRLVNDPGNELEIYQVTMFQQYAAMVVMSFIQLTFLLIQVPRGAVSANRINEVLKTKISIDDPLNKTTKNSKEQGKIEFKNVSFSYAEASESVLKDITFTVNPGEMVAFIGSTGSGKSTLINLIPRFFDATKGSIKIEGIDVKDYMQSDLRNKIGYVPQKGMLFSGTILSNLKYGMNNPTKEQIDEALDIACATEFVEKLEDGIEYKISQGGKNVSGGQRQRLSIARAVIKKPSIYIFDDSFSALDYKTDLLVREKLEKHTKGATKLIVAQRIGTIINANKIIVLDKGEICGIGTHKELLQTCDVYKEIAHSQLSKEELANA